MLTRIIHNQGLLRLDDVLAEGMGERRLTSSSDCFRELAADAGKILAIFVYQRDECYRNI
jgi:hypothetical protein